MVHSTRQTGTTSLAYEELVAAHFRARGYSVDLTPRSNDYGVDAFARKDNQKLALQAKMYGGTTRRVNRAMVMQLHGARDYFDCTEAVIVTDGEVAEDARQVAEKLRIKILSLPAEPLPQPKREGPNAEPELLGPRRSDPTFDEIWEQFLIPLSGRTLVGSGGRSNTLLTVDWSGVKRLTSSQRPQFIPIEVFRQAVGRLIERGCVTRHEINEDYVGRASSGVVLILSQVPFFEHLGSPSRLVLRKESQGAGITSAKKSTATL